MAAGVLQVNARLPKDLLGGSYYAMQLQVGDSLSAAVQIWVKP
jgi:uncharacterized protein (TIGR03437 family)